MNDLSAVMRCYCWSLELVSQCDWSVLCRRAGVSPLAPPLDIVITVILYSLLTLSSPLTAWHQRNEYSQIPNSNAGHIIKQSSVSVVFNLRLSTEMWLGRPQNYLFYRNLTPSRYLDPSLQRVVPILTFRCRLAVFVILLLFYILR